MQNYVFTSESVSEGHPDKICDRISDAILDAYLTEDPYARTGIETLATTNRVIVAGEIRGSDHVTKDKIECIVRNCVRDIGYEQDGFHWKNLTVHNYLHQQSADIAIGVDEAADKEEGAGDQGIMFGYACRETDMLMPAPIYYAHNILRSLADGRHSGALPELGPDAKCQISVLYEDKEPVKTSAIVVSTQHREDVSQQQIEDIVRSHVAKILPQGWMCPEEQFYINPTGRFVIGGPDSDTGLTGRKLIVDTYGGAVPHGGGAFSGKDPTKVDRSAAYVARYLAKNIVSADLADRCTVQLSYAIGIAQPTSIYVNFHGTGRIPEDQLTSIIPAIIDLSPRGIRETLQLNKPIYARTASYGHFGRSPDPDGGFSWEKLNLVNDLKSACNLL
jgi:S-adenosylmethionine synthetase